jgi:hypothetical protein
MALVKGLAAVLVALALLIAGCGSSDDDTGTGGSDTTTTDTSGDTSTSDTSTTDISTIDTSTTDASTCDTNAHPAPVPIPDDLQGFVRLCASSDGRAMRIDSTAHMVVLVRPNAQRQTYTDLSAAPATLADIAIGDLVEVSCGDPWCRVPPGASLQLRTVDPVAVRVLLRFDFDQTVATTFVKVAAGQLAGKLQRKGGAQRLAACATGVQSTLNGSNWEEAFMSAAGTAPGCNSLFREAFGLDEVARNTAVRRMLTRARELSGGAWADAALLAAKALHP